MDDFTKENGMDIAEEAVEVFYAEKLKPEEIRWFYKDGVDKRWIEFCGYDSLRIENAWRQKEHLNDNSDDSHDAVGHNDDDADNNTKDVDNVVVKGGMYDVELDNMKCVSIYWPGNNSFYFILNILKIIIIYFVIIQTHLLVTVSKH